MVTTNVADYGAIGDGKYDSTTAFQTAIAEANAQNTPVAQEVLIPPGSYIISQTLVLDGMRGIRMRCQGSGITGGALAGARLLFTMATGTAALSARNTTGLELNGLQLTNNNPGFTGRLLDARGGNGGADTFALRLENCYLGGLGGVQSAIGVDLDKAIECEIRHCNFAGCAIGVQGQAAGGASYSNQISINNCQFVNNQTVHVKNAGQAWTLRDCTFEQLTGGAAGAYTEDASTAVQALLVEGCWFGDISSGTNAQIALNGGETAVSMIGNYAGYGAGNFVNVAGNGLDGFLCLCNRLVGSGVALQFGATSGHTNGRISENSVTGGGSLSAGAPAGWVANP